MPKTALVLSGGGAKGAFQGGALEVLLGSGITFDVIAGTSVGALNGPMISAGEFAKLAYVWRHITNDLVYSKTQSIPEEIASKVLPGMHVEELFNLFDGKTSVYSNAPLAALLDEYIHLDDCKIPMRIGVTAMYEGTYHAIKSEWFDRMPPKVRAEEWRKVILASTAQPVIWPVVQSLVLEHVGLRINHLCDGGVLNVSPVWDVIADKPDEIWVVNCANTQRDRHPVSSKSVLSRLTRTFDLVLSDNYRGDVGLFLDTVDHVNETKEPMTVKSRGVTLYPTKVHLIEPVTDLKDSFEFGWEEYGEARWAHGVEQAAEAVRRAREI